MYVRSQLTKDIIWCLALTMFRFKESFKHPRIIMRTPSVLSSSFKDENENYGGLCLKLREDKQYWLLMLRYLLIMSFSDTISPNLICTETQFVHSWRLTVTEWMLLEHCMFKMTPTKELQFIAHPTNNAVHCWFRFSCWPVRLRKQGLTFLL